MHNSLSVTWHKTCSRLSIREFERGNETFMLVSIIIIIIIEVSCLSQPFFSPWDRQLEAVYQIFRYLKVNVKYNLGRIVFDGTLERSSYIFFGIGTQYKEEWTGFYQDVETLEPHRAPYALIKSLVIRVYVDANHAMNILNRWSHPGMLTHVNNTPIKYSGIVYLLVGTDLFLKIVT